MFTRRELFRLIGAGFGLGAMAEGTRRAAALALGDEPTYRGVDFGYETTASEWPAPSTSILADIEEARLACERSAALDREMGAYMLERMRELEAAAGVPMYLEAHGPVTLDQSAWGKLTVYNRADLRNASLPELRDEYEKRVSEIVKSHAQYGTPLKLTR